MTIEFQLERLLARWIGTDIAAEGTSLEALASGGAGAWAIYEASGDREISSSHASRIEILVERGVSGFEKAGSYRLSASIQILTSVDDTAEAGEDRATVHGLRVKELRAALSDATRETQLAAMNLHADDILVTTWRREPGQHTQDGRDESHHAHVHRLAFTVADQDGSFVGE